MAQPVANLVVRIAADTGHLVRGSQQASRSIDRMAAAAGTATGVFLKMSATGVAAGALAAGAWMVAARQAAAAADEIGKTSKTIGLSTTALQEWRYAASRAGVDADQLDTNFSTLSQAIGKAANGSKEYGKIFEALGISLMDASGQIKSTEQVALELAEVMPRIGDTATQNAVAVKLFGDETGRMAQFLAQGSRSIEAMRLRAHQLGIVLDEETIRKASEATDEFEDMTAVLRVAGMRLALEFLPVMRSLAALMTNPEFVESIRKVSLQVAAMVDFMAQNTGTVERFAAAIAGAMIGARMFKVPGAAVGGLMGWFSPELREWLTDAQSLPAGPEPGLVRRQEDLKASLDAEKEIWLTHRNWLQELFVTGGNNDQVRLQEQLALRLEAVRQHLMTESELETQQYMERLQTAEEAYAAQLLSLQEYQALKEQLEADHQARITDIAQRASDDRKALEEREFYGKLNATANFFGDLATLAELGGKKMFGVAKALAIASAIVSSIESTVHAYNWGQKIGGPLLGVAFAAAAMTAQVARVAAIQAVQPTTTGSGAVRRSGGGGGGGSGGGGGAVPGTTQSLYIEGIDPGRLYSGAAVRQLAEQLLQYQRDGGRVILAPV